MNIHAPTSYPSVNPLISNHYTIHPIFHTAQHIPVAQSIFATRTAKIIFTNHILDEELSAFHRRVA